MQRKKTENERGGRGEPQTKVLEEARELKGIDSEISLQRSGHFFL